MTLTVAEMNAMSPEEFAKLDPNDFLEPDEETEEEDNTSNQDTPAADTDESEEESDANAKTDEDNQEDEEEEDESEGDESDEENDTSNDEQNADENNGADTKEPAKKADTKTVKTDVKQEEVVQVNHEEFYTKVTSEFKANGNNYVIKDPADVVNLMQKGLNYVQKMTAIKPYMTVGKVLEDNELLDPEKLAYLIDLHNKKPEAIAKLIKDSGIDAFELDEDKAAAYTATPINIPSDSQLQLQEVIASNKDNTDFTAVFETANKWDQQSQTVLINNPEYLNTLTLHKKNGVFDKVMDQVRYLQDVKNDKTPTIELYHNVGLQLYGNGTAQAQQTNKTTTAPVKVVKTVDPLLEKKRNALRSNKGTAQTQRSKVAVKSEEDIYSLSPEEFAKIDINLLLPKS